VVIDALRLQAPDSFWQMLALQQLGIVTPPVAGNLPSATVAVCTRDRPDDLRRCLEGIRRLTDKPHETMVVDSASRSPATRSVAADFPEVRYVRLERRGLNVARNAAMAAATGEIVVFIDDDAVPDPDWLMEHRKAFAAPLTMASTGLTLPLELETEAQELFEVYGGFSRGFSPRTFHAGNFHPLAAGQAGAGVNMAVRREATRLVGPFDDALDAGTPTHSGGESEFFSRILSHHYRIEYRPTALNWHRHRRTMPELRRTLFGYGVGVYAFWTARALKDREWGAAPLAAMWLWHDQLPRLLRSLEHRPGSLPHSLLSEELRGCMIGPWAYWRSRRLVERRGSCAGREKT
jgi:glycosyltransferase involved in cell wall biosynthesis